MIDENLTQREIGEAIGLSHTATRWWLRHHGLKTLHDERGFPRDPSIARKCLDCGDADTRNFYGRRWNLCKPCDNARNIKRGRDNRAFARKLLGGKCSRCPMNHPAALDIHHTDPTKKDRAFGSFRTWGRERILRELTTCILLCRNCHAIEHWGLSAKTVQSPTVH